MGMRQEAGRWACALLFMAVGSSARCWGQGLLINTVAGNGTSGYSGDNGPAAQAEIFGSAGVAVDSVGNVYIADINNNRVRKVAANGLISTVAGNGTPGYTGDGGLAINAEINYPHAIKVDAAGNLYILDTNNCVIRKVTANGIISTYAGNGNQGYTGDNGPALQAELNYPVAMVLDAAGNLYIADLGNFVVRKIAFGGTITTVAGTGTVGFSGDGGPATSAELRAPVALALDGLGNLFIADETNYVIRKVAPDQTITSVAGNGTYGYSGDGGPATSASLKGAEGVGADAAGNVYISDEDNNRVRMVTAGNQTITTIAGTGVGGFTGDGIPAAGAEIWTPEDLVVGPGGWIYFSDSQNRRVRVLTPPTAVSTGGVVSASEFGQFTSVAPGSWIEIYGASFAGGSRSWTGSDFSGVNAPTKLDSTTVTIGGQPAFIDFISPGQVNAQVPSNAALGMQQLAVTSSAGISAAYPITVNLVEPGLLAPPSFNIGGKQYVGALFQDGVTWVLPPGAIPGVPSGRATPGDAITLYGVGFGSVTPATPAGQIVQQNNTLQMPFELSFGQTAAVTSYSGLAPGAVGLYQFNVVVPNVPPSDTVPLTFTLGGIAGAQTLYIAVRGG